MKIIHKGTIPEPAEPWYVGKTISCATCKTVVELEEGDTPLSQVNERHIDGRCAALHCSAALLVQPASYSVESTLLGSVGGEVWLVSLILAVNYWKGTKALMYLRRGLKQRTVTSNEH